jgi:quercetin dioxygenase-like cupin family protein
MQTDVLGAGEGRAFWIVGDLYTILASGEDTGGAFALIHAVVPPGGGPLPHVHRREDEAFYVLEGELTFHADGRDIAATAGAWVTLAKGSRHFFRNIGSTAAKMLIVVTPSGLVGHLPRPWP